MSVIWENREHTRFIVSGPFDQDMPNLYVVIADFGWYVEHTDEIESWMDLYLPRGRSHREGMVITFEHSHDCSHFLLRWMP